jgi:serine/threonine-protein kinase
MELQAGVVLAGRYRLERKIGEGGMGAVWVAKNLSVGTEVAVKTLTLDASANSEIVMRFRREAYLLACVQSDHVCRVLDFASDERYGHILVLEFIRGQSIHEHLKERLLSVEEALDIGTDVARGMLDLHRASIVHRDLKPGNVLLEQRADGRMRALIVDFGLGRRMRTEQEDASGITSMDTALGTLEYMAPEQIVNSRGAGPQADIYSLGAILYRSVTGRHLFGELRGAPLAQAKLGHDPPLFASGRSDPIAVGFEAIVQKTLKRKPADRYATTDELLADLLALHRRRDEIARSAAPLPRAPAPSAPPVGVAAPLPRGESPWAKSKPPDPPIEPAPNRGDRARKQGFSGVSVFFVALISMIAGAAIGTYAERLRSEEARRRDEGARTAIVAAVRAAPPAEASATSTSSAPVAEDSAAPSATPSGEAPPPDSPSAR